MTDLRKRQYIGALVAMVLVIVVAFFVFGDKHDMCPPRLVHIDSLMEKNPKAAYDSLLHIDSTHIYDGDKSMEMRMLMLKAKAQNKLDMKMPSDSVSNKLCHITTVMAPPTTVCSPAIFLAAYIAT